MSNDTPQFCPAGNLYVLITILELVVYLPLGYSDEMEHALHDQRHQLIRNNIKLFVGRLIYLVHTRPCIAYAEVLLVILCMLLVLIVGMMWIAY